MDKDGNMVSLIQSNYRGMGSGMVPPQLGFMLQDRDVSTLQKRPQTHMPRKKKTFFILSFSFVTKNGQPFMSFGVMGGDFSATRSPSIDEYD
jgi:gamma-glutamyltranspeptidase/glutathione hydrolase